MKNILPLLLASVLCSLFMPIPTARAQGTAFTYQGRLAIGTNAANGIYDLRFGLFNALSSGTQIGPSRTNAALAVSNGYFAVTLDFTNGAFPGADRWLDIGVRTNGNGAFTTLTPRQKITPTPYAITASNLSGTLPAGQLSGTLPAASLAGTYGGALTLNNPANALSGNGSGLTALNASQLASGTVADARLTANVALRSGGNTFSGNQIFNVGNVGIGTPAPGALLQVGDVNTPDSQGMMRFASRSGNDLSRRYWDIGVPEGDENIAGKFYSFVIDDPVFNGTVPEFVIRWDTGNVGIGTETPPTKLAVNGTVTAAGLHWAASELTDDQGGAIELGNSAAFSRPYIDFHYGIVGPQDFNVRLINDGDRRLSVLGDFGATGTVTATRFSGDGAGLANLTAANLTGTVADARLSANVALRSGGNDFQGNQTIAGTVTADRFVATAAEPAPNVLPVLGMVWIKPGTFIMGSRPDEPGRNPDEGPQTVVTLTKGFWMGVHEVMQVEYLTVMSTNPSGNVVSGLFAPVERVSWNDATNYCGRLTVSERTAGRLPVGWGYRLPTEAEWEYACRAGARTTRFSYGDDLTVAALGNYAWYAGNNTLQTHPVEQKLANPWGLMDMHGNVFEWCQDFYGSYPGGSVTDAQGPGSGSSRVMRGGGSRFNAIVCRSAYRDSNDPGYRISEIGFRVVLAPGQP